MQGHKKYLFRIFIIIGGVLYLPLCIASTTNHDAPENMVRIGDFYMDTYEFPNKIGELPVTEVTWHEAQGMCVAVGKRLCTGDEWVKACRGPQGLRFPYGPTYDPTKCNSDTKASMPMRIGDTPPACVSGYGVYDMNGNVWEWVGSTPEDASIRGGAWSSSSCAECALVFWEGKPATESKLAGFRCCE
jgi:eukaryotic-like serine/threonine-protein kinase